MHPRLLQIDLGSIASPTLGGWLLLNDLLLSHGFYYLGLTTFHTHWCRGLLSYCHEEQRRPLGFYLPCQLTEWALIDDSWLSTHQVLRVPSILWLCSIFVGPVLMASLECISFSIGIPEKATCGWEWRRDSSMARDLIYLIDLWFTEPSVFLYTRGEVLVSLIETRHLFKYPMCQVKMLRILGENWTFKHL